MTALASFFRDAVPADVLVTDPDIVAPYLDGWRGVKRGVADLVLRPRTLDDVVAIVRAAGRHGIGLVPQGGNTSLVGGSIPEPLARQNPPGRVAVLSLKRMQRIRALDADGLSMEVEAGAILADVHEAAAKAGVRFPLSLASKGSATIGGLVSTNAGGTQVLRFGPMRALVLGLEAVLPDGRVLRQLKPLRKDNTGYDVKQLLIGAEGTLGVVTCVGLRLAPLDRERAVAWAGTTDVGAALKLLARLRQAAGESVETFELVGAAAAALLRQYYPDKALPLNGAHAVQVLIEVACPQAMLESLLADAVAAGEVADAAIALTPTQERAFLELREHVPLAEKQDGGAVKNDISVAVHDVPALVARVSAMFRADYPDARPVMFGHLGDGNLHYNLRPPRGAPADWLDTVGEEARHKLHDIIHAFNGSISAEHGIGTLKEDELWRLADPGKLAAMRAIKRALDPLGIMNPGKIFPEDATDTDN